MKVFDDCDERPDRRMDEARPMGRLNEHPNEVRTVPGGPH